MVFWKSVIFAESVSTSACITHHTHFSWTVPAFWFISLVIVVKYFVIVKGIRFCFKTLLYESTKGEKTQVKTNQYLLRKIILFAFFCGSSLICILRAGTSRNVNFRLKKTILLACIGGFSDGLCVFSVISMDN